MSKYTTEVRYIVETSAGLTESVGFDDVEDIVETACPIIFNFNFPIFDETYRLTLEKKILMHYYTREISEETVGLWKLRLCNRLREIMPYYNKLYESELLTFNPLYDTDLRTDYHKTTDEQTTGSEVNTDTRETEVTGKSDSANNSATNRSGERTDNYSSNNEANRARSEMGTNKQTTTDNANANSTNWNLYSDTPQGGIEGIESDTAGSQTVNNMYYLTNATKQTYTGHTTDTNVSSGEDTNTVAESDVNKQQSENKNEYNEGTTNTTIGNVETESNTKTEGNYTSATSGTVKNIDDYADHVIGKRGGHSYARLLTEFRETFLNIDMMVINDLRDLFFGLWA